jgi:hypothetical protein
MLKRRTAVFGLSALAAAPAIHRARAALPDTLDPTDPAHIALLQKKLIYSADNRPLIWWIRGKKYGSINGEITPLWVLNVALFKYVEHKDDGAYDVKSMEIVYKTDIETDLLLSEWRNPYNGEVYEEVPLIMGPVTRGFTDAGPVSQSALPGAEVRRRTKLGPADVAGDHVWLQTDAQVEVERPGQDVFRANDLSTYHGRVSDILNPDLASAPGTMTVHIIQSWHPWMNMGDQPGTLVTRISGAKGYEVDDLHPRIAQLVKDVHPDIAQDYVARLQGPPERFDR